MSAADRMAVRMPGGEIRSVPRRVGLAMVARSQATHAPAQSAPNPTAKGRRPVSAVTVVTAEAPQLDGAKPDAVVVDEPTAPVVDLADPEHGPVIDPAEVFEEDEPTAPPAVPLGYPVRPKGNAAREVWAEYARVQGVEIFDDMGRNDIRDAVDAKFESDRMSRPALQGGRPATPEDEPVTEDMVTSADPGERTA